MGKNNKYETLIERKIWVTDKTAVAISAYKKADSKDTPRVSIRKYISSDNYTGYTNKGVSFHPEWLDKIEKSIKEIDEELKKMGY